MILIDAAEPTYVLKTFDELGFPYRREELSIEYNGEKIRVGDFTNDKQTFIAERKRIDDLWKSLCDYRIYTQLDKLDECFDGNKYLIIEGYQWFADSVFDDFEEDMMLMNAMSPLQRLSELHKSKENWIYSVIEECVCRNIAPIQTWDVIETAKWVHWIDKGAGNSPKVRATKKVIKSLSLDVNMLTTIPGIGKGRAEALMEEFGTLAKLVGYIRNLKFDDIKTSKILTKLKEVFG